ncbi:MAG: tetratricopeptide repeat protein [Polyangia bacterium]
MKGAELFFSRLACVTALLVSLFGCGDGRETDPAVRKAAEEDSGKLLEEGYQLKKTGHNAAALERFDKACQILAETVGSEDFLYASCLDDKAMILIRTGRYDEARAIYERGREILKKRPQADPRLALGVARRLRLLDNLEKRGVKCSEPAEPPPSPELPYFPDPAVVQSALGTLADQLRDCDEGNPHTVTVMVWLTGEGKPIMIEARGKHDGTPVGNCLVGKLEKLVPSLEIPRFRACFRPFTYPYVVGDVRVPIEERAVLELPKKKKTKKNASIPRSTKQEPGATP